MHLVAFNRELRLRPLHKGSSESPCGDGMADVRTAAAAAAPVVAGVGGVESPGRSVSTKLAVKPLGM